MIFNRIIIIIIILFYDPSNNFLSIINILFLAL